MSLGAILSAAGLAAALSLTAALAEVLAFNSTSAINGKASVSDPPVMDGDTDVANGANSWGFEVQSAPIVSPDGDDLDRGALTVTVVHEPSWATTLLGFAGLGL
jgi:hypothetical protein